MVIPSLPFDDLKEKYVMNTTESLQGTDYKHKANNVSVLYIKFIKRIVIRDGSQERHSAIVT